ncbi:hypothetical protein EFE41_06160 [Methanohalophilus portucalensis FDF-1]|uniref:Uncharacterized protein n=2 Tax=Methanohalophilus portucalensis TaxID=39664 RepID=A0A3M9LCU5_9EURY|nr:hypothetical protein BKM01_09650 [Methanohalophilus portucalensis]RNI11144.1 hypothetical protein EFE41_06160 [Methanohalophilus portucalensis FDF-1]
MFAIIGYFTSPDETFSGDVSSSNPSILEELSEVPAQPLTTIIEIIINANRINQLYFISTPYYHLALYAYKIYIFNLYIFYERGIALTKFLSFYK